MSTGNPAKCTGIISFFSLCLLFESFFNLFSKSNKFKLLLSGSMSKIFIFKSLYKDKNIKMIETKNINYGGGNIHCVTMNVPKI